MYTFRSKLIGHPVNWLTVPNILVICYQVLNCTDTCHMNIAH